MTWTLIAAAARDDRRNLEAVFRRLASKHGGIPASIHHTESDAITGATGIYAGAHVTMFADFQKLPQNAKDICARLSEQGWTDPKFVTTDA
jgi:hypothetical protein